ncbi:MAG: toprim domain-containing protein, partial [Planctomycetia bacterium]|nr:toprim domain-containing protein [Planctomycetia bacterium]
MNRNFNWQRVSKANPCPVCGRPDWCLYAGPDGNPSAVICTRIESEKRCGDAGWLHRLRDDRDWRPSRTRRVVIHDRAPQDGEHRDFDNLATRFEQAIGVDALEELAGNLCVSGDSLRQLRTGWSAARCAYSFPMSDSSGRVVGIRLRLLGGGKISVDGGKEGLFVPRVLDPNVGLLICEGPTDTAAILDLGFNAIGRPSCSGGLKLIVDLVQRRQPSQVVVIADRDAPGQQGAENLAAVLVAYSAAVRVIAPSAG